MKNLKELTMEEMMAVDGGGKGHDLSMIALSAEGLVLGAAAAPAVGTVAIVAGTFSVASLAINAIKYNYDYAPRSSNNAHHR